MSNVVALDKNKRLRLVINKLSLLDFSHNLNGFRQIDEKSERMYQLAKENFDAFWSEIGPLAREDFLRLLK